MAAYTVRRLLRMIPLLLAVVTLVFFMLRMIPGDPARLLLEQDASEADVTAMRHQLGLDQPLLQQYTAYLSGLTHGYVGTSFRTGRPVLQDEAAPLKHTFVLAVTSMAFATVFGIGLGVVAGARPYSAASGLTMVIALLGVSAPSFWLALLLMVVFSLKLDLLPAAGAGTWQHLVLPTITLGTFTLGVIARITRASVSEVMRSDYIRTARSKGVAPFRVVYGHALKNAMIPVITIAGLHFGYMLGGAVATETVFNWPGLGRHLVDAILSRDFPAVQGGLLIFSVTFLTVNLLVDLAYAVVDPRIAYR